MPFRRWMLPMHFGKKWSAVVPRTPAWLCSDRVVLMDKAAKHIVTLDVRLSAS